MKKIFIYLMFFVLIFPNNSNSKELKSPSWTGMYAGINIGQSTGDADIDYSQKVNFCGANNFQSNSGCSFSKDVNNEIDSLFTGANFTILQDKGAFVFGIQADLDYNLDSKDRFSEVISGYGDELIVETETVATSSFKMLFGIPHDNFLGYVNAGPAVALIDTTTTQNAIGYIPKTIENYSFVPGYSLGLGAKYKVQENWLLGAEYSYTDLAESRKESNLSFCCGGIAYPDSITKSNYDYSSLKLSLSYKFN